MHRPRSASEGPTLLLVDLDDTLFDHASTSLRALSELREEYPALRAFAPEELARRYATHLEELHPRVLAGELSIDEARLLRTVRVFAEAGEAVSRSEARRRAARLRALYQASRHPVDGAREFLEFVHARARIVIVTNNLLAEQQEKLAFLGLTDLIDGLVTSEELGLAKPDPRFFHAALERGGMDAAAAVVLGDSWESDVEGARAAGLPVVWFNRFDRERPPGLPAVPELTRLRPPEAAWEVLVEARRALARAGPEG